MAKSIHGTGKFYGEDSGEVIERDMELVLIKKHDLKEDDFRTEYGKGVCRRYWQAGNKGETNWLWGIHTLERWMYNGSLPAMTYMVIPRLIAAVEKGTFRKEYEGLLKELHPRSYKNFLKTGKIITAFKPVNKRPK